MTSPAAGMSETGRRPASKISNEPAELARFGAAEGTTLPFATAHQPDTDTTVELIHHDRERFYELMEDGASVGLLIYERNPSRTGITHAMIRKDRRGRGLGSVLMAGALDHLYANNSNILVYCDSVAQFLVRHPEYRSRLNPAAQRLDHNASTPTAAPPG